MPSVGLAIIAKNEESRLPNLLKSIEGAFDQIAFVDTGSTDSTLRVFADWALAEKERNPGIEYIIESFEWVKDFSAARTFAHSLLTTDWEVWADCDDVIQGAQSIRAVVAQAQENVAAFVCDYDYAQHPQTGSCVCRLRRERVVRRGMARWVNRVHEAQVIDGPVMRLGPDIVHWVHRKQYVSMEEMQAADTSRNLDILDAWVEDEPTNTRVLAYLGTENLARGEAQAAIAWFNRYLECGPDWDEEHAQVRRKLAAAHLQVGEYDQALSVALRALTVMPSWPDTYLSLAEASYARQEWSKAIEWAQEALRRGVPDTMLIVNPLDYTYQPRKILAGSLAMLKQWEKAVEVGQEAFSLNPGDIDLQQMLQAWQVEAKKERTANQVATMAQQLIAHDERLKALRYLEHCVPHFVNDHPGVVQLRSLLRENMEWVGRPQSLLEHYATGGSKPEDFLDDETSDKVAAALPRVQFLYEGLHEQDVEARHHSALDNPNAEAQLEAAVELLDEDTLRRNLAKADLGVFAGGSVGISDYEDYLHNDRRIT